MTVASVTSTREPDRFPVPQAILRLPRTRLSIPVGPSGTTVLEVASSVDTLGCTSAVVVWRIFELSSSPDYATLEVVVENVTSEAHLLFCGEVLTMQARSTADVMVRHEMLQPLAAAVRVCLRGTSVGGEGKIDVDMALDVIDTSGSSMSTFGLRVA